MKNVDNKIHQKMQLRTLGCRELVDETSKDTGAEENCGLVTISETG